MAEETREVERKDVIIKYSGKNLITIPIGKFKLMALKKAGIELKKKQKQVQFTEGTNVVDAEIWKLIREDVAHHLEPGGLMKEINVKDVKSEKVKFDPEAKDKNQSQVKEMTVEDITAMNSKEAIKIIKEMNNLVSLEALAGKETRDGVLKEINKMIDEIKKPPSEKK